MRTIPDHKTCRMCGHIKPREEFPEGRRVCHSCLSDYRKQLYRRRRPSPDGVRFCRKANEVMEYRNGIPRKFWNPNMINELRRLYPTTKNEELAPMFGISVRTLNRKAAELGLEKDRCWMQDLTRKNAFFATQASRKVVAKNLIKARKALEIKYNNPNFTRKDRERYETEYNL